MFRSKVSSILRNVANISQHDAGSGTLYQFRLVSNEVSPSSAVSTENYVPDKLYKKLQIEVRGNDPAVLQSYGTFVIMAANHLNISVLRNTTPRKPIHERLTLLKSVHVHKNHRVQYETRTYFRFLDFEKLTGSTADTFLEYIQRNLPEGVAMKATKVELQRLPETVMQESV